MSYNLMLQIDRNDCLEVPRSVLILSWWSEQWKRIVLSDIVETNQRLCWPYWWTYTSTPCISSF